MSDKNDKPLKDRAKGLEDEWIRQREAEQRKLPGSFEQDPKQDPKQDNEPDDQPAPKQREPLWPLGLAFLALAVVIASIWFH